MIQIDLCYRTQFLPPIFPSYEIIFSFVNKRFQIISQSMVKMSLVDEENPPFDHGSHPLCYLSLDC